MKGGEEGRRGTHLVHDSGLGCLAVVRDLDAFVAVGTVGIVLCENINQVRGGRDG